MRIEYVRLKYSTPVLVYSTDISILYYTQHSLRLSKMQNNTVVLYFLLLTRLLPAWDPTYL